MGAMGSVMSEAKNNLAVGRAFASGKFCDFPPNNTLKKEFTVICNL
jgi:hypothetical protein